MKKWAAILAMAGAGRMIAVLYSGSLFLATIQQSNVKSPVFASYHFHVLSVVVRLTQ